MIKIIFLVMAAFGESNVRVEDGTPVSAQNNLSRSVALMLFSHGGNCSASFLTTKMLVTAAHCTRGVAPSSVRIMIRDSKGVWNSAEVGKLITHPQFVQSDSVVGARIKNDIGLVQLKNEFSIPVRPLKIGSVGDMVTERDVTVVGYGWNVPNSGARTLRTGVMRGIIQSHYNFFNREGIYMVPKKSQAVCPGDSGGAVLKGTSTSMLLIGVHSLSNGCKNSSETFSISEIVIDHKAWIKKYIPSI